jgi:hypothetical protein
MKQRNCIVTLLLVCLQLAFITTTTGQQHFLLFPATATAVSNFEKQFPDAENITWSPVGKERHVHFTQNGFNHQVWYSEKGKWMSTIRIADPLEIPGDIAHDIRSAYPDHAVFFTQHLATRTGQCWIIKIRSGASWKELKCGNDEIEVTGDYIDPNYR